METQNPAIPTLDLLLRPAFYATDGKITQTNQSAAALGLCAGDEIAPLLITGATEYAALREGCLCLMLCVGGRKSEATVLPAQQGHLFVLEQDTTHAQLRALSLAAGELRDPLTGMLCSAGQLIGEDAPREQLAQFNRRMHQLLRVVSNMSDAVYYCESSGGRMETVQLCAFLDDLLSKASDQLSTAGLHLRYTLPNTAVYTLVDPEKLERAIYNLISNAAKNTMPGGDITVSLTQKDRFYFSVTDGGLVDGRPAQADAYTRYLRTPAVTDGADGIGLGMVLIRATAALHGGTVLIDHPGARGTRVTMTLELRHTKAAQVRSPILYPDYAGERDHCLQELADVLPADLYADEKVF